MNGMQHSQLPLPPFLPTNLLAMGILNATAVFGSMAVIAQEPRDRDAPSGNATSAFQRDVNSRYIAPGSFPGREFKLGIYGANTATGVEIRSVTPGSTAQQSGLEARDTIVTVAGYQVGMVNGRLYDLGDELARRVDPQGNVNLLVRNHRNGQLVNVPVRFAAATITVSGSIQSADRRPSPLYTSLVVRLLDVTSSNWQSLVIRQVNLGTPQRWPVNYRIEMDSAAVSPQHRYAVDAQLVRQGLVVSNSGPAIPVSLAAGNRVVNLMLQGSLTQLPGRGRHYSPRPGTAVVPTFFGTLPHGSRGLGVAE